MDAFFTFRAALFAAFHTHMAFATHYSNGKRGSYWVSTSESSYCFLLPAPRSPLPTSRMLYAC